MAPIVHLLLPETMPASPTATLRSLQLRPLLQETYTSFTALVRERVQCGLLLMQCALFTGWSAALAVVPLYAADTWGSSPSELGSLYAVSAALGIVGGPLGGLVADGVGRRPAVIGASAICSACFASFPFVESYPQLMCAMAALGFGETFLMSAHAALATDVTPPELRGAFSALSAQVHG